MRNICLSLLVILLSLTACKKEQVNRPAPAPVPTATMKRTITLNTQGTRQEAIYESPYPFVINAGFNYNNDFFLTVEAPPRNKTTVGEMGDAVIFGVDKTKLNSSYTGIYNFQAGTDASTTMLGGYNCNLVQDVNGHIISALYTTMFGSHPEGFLRIDNYDPEQKLISGSYQVLLKNVQPPSLDRAIPIPNELCTIEITGTFSNVPVK